MSLKSRRLVRAALLLTGVVIAAACGSTTSQPQAQHQQINVAIIEEGPATVGSYNSTHTAAFTAMCQKYNFQCHIIDNVDYPKAAETLRNLASQGTNLIIANSNGYADALLEVAPQFPKTWFVMTSDIDSTKGNKNLAAFVQNWQEFGFMGGLVAGYLTRTGVMGYVIGQELTAAKAAMSGFLQGADIGHPGSKLLYRYTNSWTDTAAAKDAAQAEMAAGADVVTGIDGGGNPGIIQAAQEQKTWYIGYLADEYQTAPGSIPTSMVENVGLIYDEVGGYYTNHTLQPKIYMGTVANGVITLAPFHNVPQDVIDKVNAEIQKLKSGEFQVQSTLYPPQ